LGKITADIEGGTFFNISESARLRSKTRSMTRIWPWGTDDSLECMKSTHLRAVLKDGKSIACSLGWPCFLTMSSANATMSLCKKKLGHATKVSMAHGVSLRLYVWHTVDNQSSSCWWLFRGLPHTQCCLPTLEGIHLRPARC
jgi:hypothetical protein